MNEQSVTNIITANAYFTKIDGIAWKAFYWKSYKSDSHQK